MIFINLDQSSKAQNLVRNPNFSLLDSCPSDYGQIYFAKHWFSGNDQSPDLFDSCATNIAYAIPISNQCTNLNCYKDNGVVGIVTFGESREIITSYLNRPIPSGRTLYCRFMASPIKRCDDNGVLSNICYHNGLGMAIDYKDGKREVILKSKDILDNIEIWLPVHGCYITTGDEEKISIKNFDSDEQCKADCQVLNTFNFGYTFIDNIVFEEFNVLPDTLFVCNSDSLYFNNLNFYDLPLQWEDGINGSRRNFTQSGKYILNAIVDNCHLSDSVNVYFIAEDHKVDSTFYKCKDEAILITSIFPGSTLWSTGEHGNQIHVNSKGSYSAKTTTSCGTVLQNFNVLDTDCSMLISAPNVMQLKSENLNSIVTFYVDKNMIVEGYIIIYDRWGNKVYNMQVSSNDVIWDGKFNGGNVVEKGVYTWIFKDRNSKIKQIGNITVIR